MPPVGTGGVVTVFVTTVAGSANVAADAAATPPGTGDSVPWEW
jgi:hypothetical protein